MISTDPWALKLGNRCGPDFRMKGPVGFEISGSRAPDFRMKGPGTLKVELVVVLIFG